MAMEEMKPIVVMVIVQVAYAGVNIVYKLAAEDGMNLRLVVAYRFLFASAVMGPLAFILERYTHICNLCIADATVGFNPV